MSNSIFLRRVVLRNYKSIRVCSVKLGALTFLVGPNGAGKSNFLDALRLVSESLDMSLEHALRDRGGINEVRRRSSGHPTHFAIRLDFALPDGTDGMYAFKVGAVEKGGYEVQEEKCRLYGRRLGEEHFYDIKSGAIRSSSFEIGPPASKDRLYLVAAAGMPAFKLPFDALSHMGFYNLNPEEIRDLQAPDTGEILRRDGGNLASVLGAMSKEDGGAKGRVVEFLSRIVPGVVGVAVKHLGRKETLEFRQIVGSARNPWSFTAENMSDGTLRALGVLIALFQSGGKRKGRSPLFVGIEEPEVAVHPGAAGVIRDALRAASSITQVAVTSHSPDLLDDASIPDDSVRAVSNRNGETLVGPIDDADRSSMRDRLYTAGDLLRMNQLEPDESAIRRIPPRQLEIFSDERS